MTVKTILKAIDHTDTDREGPAIWQVSIAGGRLVA
jgi:hypothetical protein